MNHVASVTALEDYEAVAWDLAHLIPENNQDIIDEFGVGATAFTGDVEYVVSNLKRAADYCNAGERQQFVGFSDEDAVGMGRVAIYDATHLVEPRVADFVDIGTPNFGIWVCNPYRATGVGRALAAACRRAIDLEFDGQAWTAVEEGNIASQRTVERMGFRIKQIIGSTLVYIYNAPDADYL